MALLHRRFGHKSILIILARKRVKNNLRKKTVLEMRSSLPHTEPEILEFHKVHFEVRKMPFRPPKKMAPQRKLNGLKTAEKYMQMSPNGTFRTIELTLGGHFLGVPTWHFSDFEVHFLEVQDFGFYMGRGRSLGTHVQTPSSTLLGIVFSMLSLCCTLKTVYNLLKLRGLDSSCPFFLGDTSIRGQRTQML